MADHLTRILEICEGTKNTHFASFAKLNRNHWEGLITHAVLRLSNGKIEGINNRIKTVRRMVLLPKTDGYEPLPTSVTSWLSHTIFHRFVFC